MKDSQSKQRFIQLRAEGRSYESIAQELKVCKNTALKWGHELADDINNLKFTICDNIIEQYKISIHEKLVKLFEEIKKVDAAIQQKNYNELSTKDLILLREKLENKMRKEFETITYSIEKDIEVDFPSNFGKTLINKICLEF